jgi:hypothetical protein
MRPLSQTGRLLLLPIVFGLLASGCESPKMAKAHAGLPVRYHNAQYDFTFFLPADWKGYTISMQQSVDEISTAGESSIWRIPMITLQHPPAPDRIPFQDIPIIVFTRPQWDALHQGGPLPSLFAGGIMNELWHTQQFVFAMSSLYNANDEARGRKEVADIVAQNCAANKMPHLYQD